MFQNDYDLACNAYTILPNTEVSYGLQVLILECSIVFQGSKAPIFTLNIVEYSLLQIFQSIEVCSAYLSNSYRTTKAYGKAQPWKEIKPESKYYMNSRENLGRGDDDGGSSYLGT